jgi:UDP-N-acetylmuramoylalanine--D-glutamate ligase
MELRGARVAVVGAGKSGVAASRLLVRHGARVRLLDRDPSAAARPDVVAVEALGAQLACGPHAPGQVGDADALVLSPGVPPTVDPVVEARRRGIPVLGEMELGARLARGRLVGITGSNGKSTTTTLCARMLEAAGLRVLAGGNLGRPLCELLLEADGEEVVHCLEVSSFQCETLDVARFEVVALLNLSADHLDRYPDLETYAAAKLHLLDQQGSDGAAILGADDARLLAAAPRARGRLRWFGLGALPGPGVGLHDGVVASTIPGASGDLFATADVWTRAPHHLANAMAAAAVTLEMGCPPGAVRRGIVGFRGLPHRGEEMGGASGPRFVNDSKATNVDAAVRAIEGCGPGAVVILGGRHKGGDVEPLARALRAQGDTAVLIGEASGLLEAALAGVVPTLRATDMADAVARAAERAGPSGTVLLAPACASFDMFRSYEHRGDTFRAEVERQFGTARGGTPHGGRRCA